MCGVGLVMLGSLCLVGCIRLSGLVGQAWLGKGTKKNPDYLVTLIKRVGRYLAEITIS